MGRPTYTRLLHWIIHIVICHLRIFSNRFEGIRSNLKHIAFTFWIWKCVDAATMQGTWRKRKSGQMVVRILIIIYGLCVRVAWFFSLLMPFSTGNTGVALGISFATRIHCCDKFTASTGRITVHCAPAVTITMPCERVRMKSVWASSFSFFFLFVSYFRTHFLPFLVVMCATAIVASHRCTKLRRGAGQTMNVIAGSMKLDNIAHYLWIVWYWIVSALALMWDAVVVRLAARWGCETELVCWERQEQYVSYMYAEEIINILRRMDVGE